MDVKDILRKYSRKIEEEINTEADTSRDYLKFKQ